MTSVHSQDSRRIAKNTALLYLRMIVSIIISLYTSRVVLNALGIEDYGIYNVIGGFVSMFSLFSGSLSAAISRFITYELGLGNVEKLKSIFSSSVTIQIILSLIVLVVAETIGLWFLKEKMIIPENRISAAFWCYQLSILTFIIGLISIPYNASIIAHERMGTFAYISIFENIIKLVIALIINKNPIDRLVFYAILLTLLSVFIRVIYGIYCKKHFAECTFSFEVNRSLLKEMFGFAGWNTIGAMSWVLREHGGTMLLNLFWGPSVNAAKAIATKVNVVVSGFAANFTTALNPQITKSYATKDFSYMFNLMDKGIRFSFFLLMLIACPILLNTQYILEIWLIEVPKHAVLFVQLILIQSLIEIISNPLITIMLATGNIKQYQIIVGGIQMLNLPCSYIALKLGCIPEAVVIISLILNFISLISRIIMLKKMVHLDVSFFLKKICGRLFFVCLFVFCISLFTSKSNNLCFKHFIITSIVAELAIIFSSLFLGCSKTERCFIYKTILRKFHIC